MHPFPIITSLGPRPRLLLLAAGRVTKTSHAPSAPRMAHRVQHRAVPVRLDVRHVVRDAVGGKSLPQCSFWAAGARPIRIPARAAALLLRKDATGFRALSLKPASLLRKAQASLPVPRSHRAPAGQGQKQNPRAGRRRKLACERSAKTFPKTPSSAPAPDWRPIPSLRSVISRPPVGRAARWTEAPHRSRLGALPPLALVGTRACFCRDQLSPRWGASFPLPRLGASHHGSSALGGLRKLPLLQSASFLPFSPVAAATCARLCAGVRAKVLALRKRMGLRALAQSQPNPDQTRDQPRSKRPSIVT